MKILIIHAYSADNKGDGLLVDETLRLAREAFGSSVEIGLVASYPNSFVSFVGETYQSRPTARGFDPRYIRLLLSKAKEYDIIISVGGGFLRGKNPIEFLKTVIVNGPQLLLASARGKDSVYLPQSIGPFSPLAWKALRPLLNRMGRVWLRDDRSMTEVSVPNCRRSPDLAILGMHRRSLPLDAESPTVLTVRHVNGTLPNDVLKLRQQLGTVDSYIQSDVGTNTDVQAVQDLKPRKVLSYSELMSSNQNSRVVVAVRLHAALMALAAGHYVIHLSYERKGFGAFQDLGLEEFVYNVNDFDADRVLRSVCALRSDTSVRESYDARITRALEKGQSSTTSVVDSLRAVTNGRHMEARK